MLGGEGRGSYMRKKMNKRKEVEDVSDDFSDFSLSSPARKIRRLDADLPPIMEEEEAEERGGEKEKEAEIVGKGIGSSVIEEMDDSENQNQERAIVLFRPVNPYLPLQHSSALSSYSVSLDPHTISGFKNQLLWPSQSSSYVKSLEGEEEDEEPGTRDRMAVIPWIPSQLPVALGMEISQNEAPELMEAEGIEQAGMDVEDNNYGNSISMAQGQAYGLPHWQQQQHCLIPQFPQASSTPITWFQ